MKVTDTKWMQNMTDLVKPDTANKPSQDFAAILNKAMESKDDKRLYQACQDMESVLMSKVLQAMRQTIPKSGWLGDSFAMDTFESMLFDEYAKLISQSNTLGLAEIMYRQLKQNIANISPVQTDPEK
ncbi:MAG TPA: rod-binding protein [Syntrophomonadaceae bacterium]|nr:muramidase [Syntrophomonadaceae bacterium]HOQ08947.1 rod-binding protein [Syntrophomonadaceae bacterium]HPU47758.1 rod-binding protein [Syntrophomonadaceae bacterium]